jgi:pilus assembly protein CpaB
MQGALSANQGSLSVAPRADRRVVIIALLLGAVAAILTFAYLRSLGPRMEAAAGAIPVVVASRNVEAGQRLTDAMIEVKMLPEAAVASSAFTTKEQVIGQAVRYPIGQGEQITGARLIEPARVPSLSFQIPPGLRGFTIPVNVQKSPAALAAPGDFVDVLVAFNVEVLGLAPPEAPRSATRGNLEYHAAVTLIQNVQVLSVQQKFAEGAGTYEPATRAAPPRESNINYVTLAVTPEDAQLLALAVDKASLLTLSLRAFGDSQTPEVQPIPEWKLLTPSNAPLQQRAGAAAGA